MAGEPKCELTIDGKTQKSTHKKRGQFGLELVYFSNYILQNKEPESGGAAGLVTCASSTRSNRNASASPARPLCRQPTPQHHLILRCHRVKI
jgi:hypothetical protein